MTTLGDAEDRGAAGERPLKRAPAAAQAPAGLVNVDGRGGADVAEEVLVGLVEGQGHALQDRRDRACGEARSEELAQKLCGVAPGDAVAHREGGDRRLQARAEGSPGNVDRQLGARYGAALRAAQPLQAMLAEDDRGRRQLRDLMARGLANGATLCLAESVAAGAALGPVVDQLIDRLDRPQRTTASRMARLGAGPPARGRLTRPRWRRGWIGRGWQRGVARVSLEALLELCDAKLQPSVRLDQLIDSHQQGERRLPVAVENRLRLGTFHSARVRRTQEGPCSPAGQGDLNAYRFCAGSVPGRA